MKNEKSHDDETAHVIRWQGDAAQSELDKASRTDTAAKVALATTEALLRALGSQPHPQVFPATVVRSTAPVLRSWLEIVGDARIAVPGDFAVKDLLTVAEAASVTQLMRQWSSEFSDIHRLRTYDYAVAALAGTLAGIADVVLVQVPKHPGFLGGAAAKGGPLSNAIKDRLSTLLPSDIVGYLEKTYPVSFDASSNTRLNIHVPGVSPRSHRLQTPGHDVLLAWIFGVRDVLMGQCTTIGSGGEIIVQTVDGYTRADAGIGLFGNLLDAFKVVAGHLLSDVATRAGLPAPLFGLFQFIQVGSINGRTVADISRAMYRSGYDFRHFLAGGVCSALIEVIVRTAWLIGELQNGVQLSAAVPINQPRLNTTLFLAHSIAAGINAGKVAVSQNVLSVNYAEWLAFAKYAAQQIAWLAVDRESQRELHVGKHLDNGWAVINTDLEVLWSRVFVSDVGS